MSQASVEATAHTTHKRAHLGVAMGHPALFVRGLALHPPLRINQLLLASAVPLNLQREAPSLATLLWDDAVIVFDDPDAYSGVPPLRIRRVGRALDSDFVSNLNKRGV